MPYTMFNLADEDRPAGGIVAMPSEMLRPSHWLPYFQVEDADKSAERNRELGEKSATRLWTSPASDGWRC